MQYCLNINPTIDKTMEFTEFLVGETNRPENVRTQAGGKPVNTAIVLKTLGGDPKVTGFVYDSDGNIIRNALEERSIFYDFHEREGASRTNLKIVDQKTAVVTEINVPGQPADTELLNRIADELVDAAFQGDAAVLSGRLPDGAPDTYYAALVRRLNAKEVRTVVDTSAAALKLAVAEGPYLIKPNIAELEQLTGRKAAVLGDIIDAAAELRQQYGIRIVVVSFGAQGALAVGPGEIAYAAGIEVPVGSTVGAGDSLVAGLLIREEASLVEMLKSGMAAAAGSVSLPGTDLCTPELYEQYFEKVVIDEDPDRQRSVR